MTGYAPTAVPGVSVKVSLDWGDLGKHFADASSEEQAIFLEAWADAMSVWLRTARDTQLALIAEYIGDPENDFTSHRIRELLADLIDNLPEDE